MSDPVDDIYLKAKVFDRVVSHLEGVIQTETRRREQLRARVALKNIRKCLDMVRQESGVENVCEDSMCHCHYRLDYGDETGC